ncbi:ABC transporter permease [Pseudarthrobacter cellobiosi]|uniref:ABC transporter permease n=1 Tax=Pseudarthrobacter cellobiosi TaxID=2953654 RepID=UPI00208EFC15|nr:ABC transporter permease [Pseudarthrobacter sp. HLT1-5]MCO4254057.1 ABC transporter permease [Pseudarthrobacter sp. HLT1-5]
MSKKALLEPSATSPAAAADSKTQSARRPPRNLWFTAGPFTVFLILFALVAVLRPAFLTGGGLAILAVQASTILLVALGQAMVLHVGSIDLSNAAIVIFAAIILAQNLGPLGPAAPIVAIGIVTLIGAANGFLVAFGQIPSFALTLGTLGIMQAASLLVSDATTVYATANTQLLAPLFGTAIGGLPLAFWVGVVLAVGLWAFLRFTSAGEGMTAVGLNETGALFSGLQTRWLKVVAFALSGLLAGFAGMLVIAQAGAASSFGLGSDLLLPGIAAAIVGGTAITGGATNPANIIFGALTVALIPIGAAAVGIPPQAQSLVYGLVIIAAVALTMGRGHTEVVK